MASPSCVSTGIKGFDETIQYLRLGDNIVWQVDNINDYKYFVGALIKKALEENRNIVYIRFAEHEELISDKKLLKVYRLDAKSGFESFSTQLHNIIKDEGVGTFYIFDCLSYLVETWASDLMIGNFFMITCPYLFELDTIAYFAIIRNYHSFKTIARIRETTQLLIDLYNIEGNFYIHPLKVWHRYSPTMFLPHVKQEDKFIPITNSIDTAKLFKFISDKGGESPERNLDFWDRLFIQAEDAAKSGSINKKWDMLTHICKIMIVKEKRMLQLARSSFSLEDLLNIKSRMIGTGFIGGKAVGMLLARNILQKDTSSKWEDFLEPHDSYYVGSDVFYTFIVQNGLWKLRMEQKTQDGYFNVAKELKEKMLSGKFSDEIKDRLMQMIDYFGQSPIIIRSSSLLEDSYGNAFAGKYESIFSVNQGSPEQRYAKLEEYIKRVFASTMNEDALTYRLQRGLDQQDEQMALLVQRVSGSYRKHYFFPDMAGVGISYNTFVWNKNMDPKAGMLRLVFGLGTRAVNRVADDYPKAVALDDPFLSPNATKDDKIRYSQHKIDLLNIDNNTFETLDISNIMSEKLGLDLKYIGIKDYEASKKLKELKAKEQESWIINFEKLFKETDFIELMKKMLKTLEKAYSYPVDTEFTLNFTNDGQYKVNLLQCRPLQTMGEGKKVNIPDNINEENIIFKSDGNFMGGNIFLRINRIIYVDPKKYNVLDQSQKYYTARLVGKLNKQITKKNDLNLLMIGPGRWGTSTPSLGIPVNFSEINNTSVLVELDFLEGEISPELSFGTHFFQDLVETNIFYAAIFSGIEGSLFNESTLGQFKNILADLLPDNPDYQDVIKVYDIKDKKLIIMSDIISRKLVCFLGND